MLTFHSVEIDKDLTRDHPLFVGNFFSLKGMWWKKRRQRQGLILSIAVAWYRLIRQNPNAPGFVNEEVFITNLTRQVKDAKIILERFFDINRIGFNFNDGNKSPTLISPKRLDRNMLDAIDGIVNEVHFAPGEPPTGKKLVKSNVLVQPRVSSFIRAKLVEDNREDLLPAVNWLLKQEGLIPFYFQPAGSLMQRDTSVWPVKAIETWPSWLRTTLFGTVVDIENSYCQFMVSKLEAKYADNKKVLEMKYPDILRADRDKTNYREELCRDVLKMEVNEDNISIVKKLIMALANGSNATPALMTNGSGRSEAVRIVTENSPHLLPSELLEVGKRLSKIAKQFKAAKRDLCIFLLNSKPTRANQKKIFQMYFEWEREARYAIWNASGRTGLMLHDGIDGVMHDESTRAELMKLIVDKTSVRVSVDRPDYALA